MNKKALLIATQRIMLSLARFLVHNKVNHKEFLEISRWAFTKAGSEVLQKNGPVTVGALSEVTGQSRNEIARAEAYPEIVPLEADLIWQNALRVLHKWHTKPEYVDQNGVPKDLNLQDRDVFNGLFDANVDGQLIFSKLVDAGSLVKASELTWKPVTRYYIPKDKSLLFNYFGQAVARLIGTLNRNINERDKEPLIERVVSTADLKESAVPLFCRVGKEQAQKFLESLDDWMSSNERDDESSEDQGPGEIGLGLYYFEN